MPRKLTRRQILAGTGAASAVLLAGCSGGTVSWDTDSGGSNESAGSEDGDGNGGEDGNGGGDVDVNVSADSDDSDSSSG